jgi:hypothetical protein
MAMGRLHILGEMIPSVPMEARLLDRQGGVVRVELPCTVRNGSAVRLEVQGGHVIGRLITGHPADTAYIGAIAVDEVVPVPSSLAVLARAVASEARARRAASVTRPIGA